MRRLFLIGCSVLLLASLSLAKDKLASQWTCGKPSEAHSMNAGDQPGHSYTLAKTTCASTKGEVGGVKEKEGVATEVDEAMGDSVTWHGTFVVTMENGDEVHYTYSNATKGIVKDGQFQSGSNKWTMAGGTGRFATAKGEGGCVGKGSDGSVMWDCTGSYSLK